MAFLKFFKATTCKLCKKNASHRWCLRRAKDICWQCCNQIRPDNKCPDKCKYHLQAGRGALAQKAAVDSQTEYNDLIKKLFDQWLISPQPEFDKRIPLDVLDNDLGKEEIKQFIISLNQFTWLPLNYFRKRLKLPLLKLFSPPFNPEEVATKWLEHLLAMEYTKAAQLQDNRAHVMSEDYYDAYIEGFQSNPILSKFTDILLVSAATSENKQQIIIRYFIGGKNFSVHLVQKNESFYVHNWFFDLPGAISLESQIIPKIAKLITENELADAHDSLKKNLKIFVNSADLHYYLGIYYSLSGKESLAENCFYRAVSIDNDFYEAKYNYAFFLQKKKQTARAKELYTEIITAQPENVNALNNLATIIEENGATIEAKEIWEKCLALQPQFIFAQKNLERLKSLAD